MNQHAIAMLLEEIATLLDMHEENRFRARAFYSAARAADQLTGDIVELAESGELEQIAGFGPATASVVRELLETGRSRMHQKLRDQTPTGFLDLLAVNGLGPKRIQTLHEKLAIETLDDLSAAVEAGRLAALPGFGVKTQEKIRGGIAFVRTTSGRRRQPEGLHLGARLAAFARAQEGVVTAEPAGEVRRLMETVDGVDIIAAARECDTALNAFLEMPGVVRTARESTERASARLSDGFELRMECVPPERFATTLLHATGSEAHVSEMRSRAELFGLRLEPDGLFDGAERVNVQSEAALYERLGLSFVLPELREGQGEIEAAAGGALPQLLAYEDLQGCFHAHTTYSDGTASVPEMAEAAADRGWRYLGIADHSQHASYAGGLTPEQVAQQHEEIDEWNRQHGARVWLFKGIEADILSDGALDYENVPLVLDSFDFVIGSVHSSFNLPPEAMTARLLRAVSHPRITMLGHATGRLLLSRKSYVYDVEAVLNAAAKAGVVVEINADPRRMDLDWRYWKLARSLGVRTSINPDAHSPRGLDVVHYGVNMARKGWLTSLDVVNAWPLETVREFLALKRTSG
jgi:DNA polymerase (family 10)